MLESNMTFSTNSELPINERFLLSENPNFYEYNNKMSKSYNKLAIELKKNNIDISLLINVVESVQNLERLAYNQIHTLGCIDNIKMINSLD